MASLSFDKNDPNNWLKETRKLFKLWMYKAEMGGNTIKFTENTQFTIPKSKSSAKNNVFPLKAGINYTPGDLNSIYMRISEAVRAYIKS